ncbi:MAG: YceI family protein [Acidimicrobiales bacterium]
MTDATFEIGPAQGTLSIRTSRAGMASKIGHDLRIEVTQWEATVTTVADEPAKTSVRVVADSRSLKVKEGTGGAKALSDSDRREIEKTTHEKMLKTDKHSEIIFESTAVSGFSGPGSPSAATVEGQLTILGTSKPVRLDVRVDPSGGGYRVTGGGTIRQTDWGIKPYSAFMGALKVKDEVEIEFDVTIPAT